MKKLIVCVMGLLLLAITGCDEFTYYKSKGYGRIARVNNEKKP